MIGYITTLYALAAATLVIAGQDEFVKCTPGEYHIIGKADCTGYYLCVFGNPMEMPPCPPGSVFSSSANVCVPKGSTFDDCKKAIDGGGGHMTASPDQGHLSPEQRCSIYSVGVFPHPTECQAYYNCSVYNIPNRYEIFERHRQYKSNKCRTSRCTPCNIRFPSCEGKRDGINVHPVRLWTPMYAVCYKERTVKQDRCQADVNGRAQLFHPEKNECVSLDMIPREHGGMMPECGTNVDGFYLDDFGRCDRYVHCQGGKYIGTIKCAVGEVFDDTRGGCVPEEKACGPCGKLDHW
ncbi:hypothetical protein MAR_012873 [Mya arenaria]|uniref:Chitin-binding type-2 domain-containing protein n=1 Tax=Mya arenaria TaxID=6604 RepID=A0ABY7G1R9_MYAAR|nr:hypothetical protein MAR_012873 [Mya arenaria]